ncbi:FAD-dependent oxidoreductase [Chloroflexota bacterium]
MENLKTDVVIVGSGGAGLAAALTAAEGGAKVIAFEEKRAHGGISNLAREIFAVESKMQRENNIPFTKDDAFKIFMEHTHWRADARLVRAYIDKTASTIKWLQQQGVEFFPITPFYQFPEMQIAAHYPKPPTGSSRAGATAAITKALRDKAKEKGVEIRLSTPVKKIVKDGERVTGVITEDQAGETIQVNAKAVIIASGGYVSNKETVKKYGGFELGRDLLITHTFELTGDGIKMAWEVGADSDGMYPQFEYYVPAPKAWALKTTLRIVYAQPYLWVNQQGERFFDEGIAGNGVYTANAIARQKNKCAYLIFDENTKKYMEEEGVDIVPAPLSERKKDVDLDGLIKAARGLGNEHIFVADSLEELSNKIGVKPDVLQKTVNEYNKFCEKGPDDLFAKNPKYLKPVKQPKFYAFRIMLCGYATIGGIKINERTEVLDKEDEVIPGLYAAGDCANGALSYDRSLSLVLRGAPLGFALNSGRIAGENALKYIAK